MTKQLKIFLMGLIIIILESLVLAVIVTLLNLTFGVRVVSSIAFDTLILVVLFGFTKLFVELWLFCLVVINRAHRRPVKLKDLQVGKTWSTALMLAFGITAITSSAAGYYAFGTHVFAFVPAILLTYLLTSRLWKKGVIWINTDKLGPGLHDEW